MDYLIVGIVFVIVASIIVLAYLIVRVWINNVPEPAPKLQTKRVIEDYDKFPVWGMEKYNQLNGGSTPYNGPMPGKTSIGTPKVLYGFPLAPANDTEVIIFNPVIDVSSNLYFATYDSTNNTSKIYGYDVTGNFEVFGFPIVRQGIQITNPLIISSDNYLFYVDSYITINILNLNDINAPTTYNNFPLTMPETPPTTIVIYNMKVSSSGMITFLDENIPAAFFKVDKNANLSFSPFGIGILDYAIDENDDLYLVTNTSIEWRSADNTKIASAPYIVPNTNVASIAIGNDGNVYFSCGIPFLYAVNKQLNGAVKKFPFMTLDLIMRVNTGADGKVYATDDQNRIYAVNSDGSFAWAETMNAYNKIYPTGNGNVFYLTNDGFNVLVAGYDKTGQFLNNYPLTLPNKLKLSGPVDMQDYMAIGKNSAIYFPLVDLADGNKTKMYAVY